MSPAANIASLLVAQGLGPTANSIFVGRDPGGTTLTITLYDYAGSSPNPKYNRSEPRVQVLVCGASNDYAGAYDKALAIKNYLLGLPSQAFGSEIYFAFRMISDITFIGYGANNRPMFTLNFLIYVDGPDVGNRVSL